LENTVPNLELDNIALNEKHLKVQRDLHQVIKIVENKKHTKYLTEQYFGPLDSHMANDDVTAIVSNLHLLSEIRKLIAIYHLTMDDLKRIESTLLYCSHHRTKRSFFDYFFPAGLTASATIFGFIIGVQSAINSGGKNWIPVGVAGVLMVVTSIFTFCSYRRRANALEKAEADRMLANGLKHVRERL